MFCMVVVMFSALIGVSPQFSRNSKNGLGIIPIFLLASFTAIFAIQSGDFVYTTQLLQTGGKSAQHLEEFYLDLWEFEKDALFWRFVVFGGSLVLLFLTINLLRVNKRFACFIFVITQLFYFGQMRNMFGFMTMFFSIALIFRYGDWKHLFFGITIGGLGLWASIFLHRSMWLYLLLLVPALIPFGKKIIWSSIIAFPFLYGLVFKLSSLFLLLYASEEMQNHGAYYASSNRESTIMQSIRDILNLLSYIYLLFIILKNYCTNKVPFPPVMSFLTRYSYILIYIGCLFLGQEFGGWLYVRFSGAGEISLMFVMMWFYYRYPRTRCVKIAFSMLIISIIYQILYICTYASNVYIERFNKISF